MNFSHYTDRSVGLAVELVNTLNPVNGEDELDAARLGDLLGAEAGPPTEDDLREARALRRRLRRAFEAESEEAAIRIINEILEEAAAVPQVSVHEGSDPHLHFEPPAGAPLRSLAATTAMGLAIVLCDYGLERLGTCRASRCRDVYVDASRNRSRRYCSEACTSRENVAAYRRRRKGDA